MSPGSADTETAASYADTTKSGDASRPPDPLAKSGDASRPPDPLVKSGDASRPPDPLASSDREIRLSRVFQAPPELVWEAFTNPKHVEKWRAKSRFACSNVRLRPAT